MSLCYDVIICLDLMWKLGLIINFKTKVVERDEHKIPMTSKTTQLNRKQLHNLLLSTREEPESTKHKHKWLVEILYTKYEAANLEKLWQKRRISMMYRGSNFYSYYVSTKIFLIAPWKISIIHQYELIWKKVRSQYISEHFLHHMYTRKLCWRKSSWWYQYVY